jgi:hypothetical protein
MSEDISEELAQAYADVLHTLNDCRRLVEIIAWCKPRLIPAHRRELENLMAIAFEKVAEAKRAKG